LVTRRFGVKKSDRKKKAAYEFHIAHRDRRPPPLLKTQASSFRVGPVGGGCGRP